MEIRTEFLPGNCVWIMVQNRPEYVKVVKIKITIPEDMDTKIVYTLATSIGPNEYDSSEIFQTKELLKKSIFG